MNRLIEFFIKNRLFGDILTLFIILIGIWSLTQIRRDAFPNVKFDVISITTIYPGSSAEGLESLVTNPIEQDLKEVDGIKNITSASIEGRSQITVQLDPDETTEQQALEDIKSVVDLVELPEEAKDPLVTSLQTKNQPIVQVAISGPMPEMELRAIAKELELVLEEIPGVSKVTFRGLRDREIQVDVDPKKLARFSISIDEVVTALRLQNNSIPAGTLDPDPKAGSGRSEVLVRTIGEYESPEDVANTVVRANELGRSIRVRDIATVGMHLAKAETLSKSDGQRSIGLTVIKKAKADAITVVDEVVKRTNKFKELKAGSGLELQYIDDISEYIRRRLSVLSGNMMIGIAMVILLLPLFLPVRVALVVSTGIFLSFFGTMAVFHYAGYSLNLLSLLGFIIVSGMLVDDAIVSTENISRHLKLGLSPQDAAIKGTQEIWGALTASVLTTVIAFLPMMFMSGIFGKFVKEIPLGVIVALLISLGESILLVPQHMYHYVKPSDFEFPLHPKGLDKLRVGFLNWWDKTVAPAYVRAVAWVIRRRYLSLGCTAIVFVIVIVIAKLSLKFILFPPEGIEVFFVRFTAPVGITLEENFKRIEHFEDIIKKLPKAEVKNFVTTIGIIQQDPNDPATKRGPEYAQMIVYLTPDSDRERSADQIIADLKEKMGKPKEYLEIKFDRVRPGPPVGKPLSIGVQGNEYKEILAAVGLIKTKVAEIDGVKEVEDSFVAGKPEILIRPVPALAAASGLDVVSIGNTVRAAIDGLVPTTLQRLDEEIDVRVRFQEKDKTPGQVLDQVRIPNRTGSLVPLKAVATMDEKAGITVYEHRNNRREVKVTGDIDTDKNSSTKANVFFRKNIEPQIINQFPGIKIVFGGEEQDTQESIESLIAAFSIAFLGIFLILILTFKNLLQPFLVVLTIPVGILSVLATLIITGQPLSFMASLGIIALAGVIVNNAIVLVSYVNQSRESGTSKADSLLLAAKTRLLPIFLTTCTTVLGLLPTLLGIGGTDKFILPIAFSLAYGLAIGSVLTAFLFPAAIAVLDDIEGLVGMIFRRINGHKN